ncbi:lactococcin 972 family bacteriocin [Streptomyces spinoverrucosus]|uniref:lactococcin 972 family bacteriocin n=1 Tax=Streptomyces spinoverrucosus TaxID=284043 RepID=UPI0018C3E754|nr:lactococcin 972 family bacteriocin [Streptomyces spinoverrucosus]
MAAAAAALTTGVLAPATSASAATPQPKDWGMVAIKVDPSSRSVTPMTTKNVGGGTWTYGTEITADGKRCYSYYFHGSKLHRASVTIAGGTSRAAESPGHTARATRTAGAAYTCYAYWANLE